MIPVDALMLFGFFLLFGATLFLTARLIWKSGFLYVPVRMKTIYSMTRERLHRAGWG